MASRKSKSPAWQVVPHELHRINYPSDDRVGMLQCKVPKSTHLAARLSGSKFQPHTFLAIRPQQLFDFCMPQVPHLYNGHKGSTHCMGLLWGWMSCQVLRTMLDAWLSICYLLLLIWSSSLRTHRKEIMQKMPKASHVKFILVLTRRVKTRNDPNGHCWGHS